MSRVKPWLPDTCLTSRAAVGPIAHHVAAWTADWFRSDPWDVLGTWDESNASTAQKWTQLRECGAMTITGKSRAQISLALAILGSDLSARDADTSCTQTDLRLLRRIASRALDDLAARVKQAFPATTSADLATYDQAEQRVFSLLIGSLGSAMIAFECSEIDLTTICRETFPSTDPASTLVSCNSAIEDVALNVAARLGATSISMGELSGLGVGDILILDQSSNVPTSLTINNHVTPLLCTIGESNNSCVLEFQGEA